MKKVGPGLLVMAAFIGPGTVTTASIAGANFGFALLWALLFSVMATLVLQEMAARLGLVSGQGLAEALRTSFRNPLFSRLSIVLVVAAIGFGNAAYESGNISGAALALQGVTDIPRGVWAVVVALIAGSLLASGRYRVVESSLVALVAVMSVVFIVTMVLVEPDLGSLFSGLLRPSLPSGSALTIMALIGTTVVPYNLFLHASSVRQKWSEEIPLEQALKESRQDTRFAVSLGGLITLAIVSTAAAAFFGTGVAFSASTLSIQLEPLLGDYAGWFFASGLFAAGLTSAITSPLAAAYAVCGSLGWPVDMAERRFKLIWIAVLTAGALVAALGARPIAAIMFAQASNGFLLPLVAIFLLLVMNREDLLGQYCNTWRSNLLGALVIAIVLLLSAVKLAQVASLI